MSNIPHNLERIAAVLPKLCGVCDVFSIIIIILETTGHLNKQNSWLIYVI